MKKIVVSIAALLLLSTAAIAQDNQGQRPERPRVDRTEMIKQRTDDLVKKYGLNEEQATQLLSLNTHTWKGGHTQVRTLHFWRP